MSEANSPKSGGLWARLLNLADSEQDEPQEQPKSPEAVPPVAETAVAVEAPPSTDDLVLEETATVDSNGQLVFPPVEIEEPKAVEAGPALLEPEPPAPPAPEPAAVQAPPAPAPAPPAVLPEKLPCPACQTLLKTSAQFCDDCGFMLPTGWATAAAVASQPSSPGSTTAMPAQARLKNRYEMGALLSQRQDISRYRGLDHGAGPKPVSIVIVTAPVVDAPIAVADTIPAGGDDEILPAFDDVPLAIAEGEVEDAWPSIAWEKCVLEKAQHPVWPKVLDSFAENGREYLILEQPVGGSIWDAWDDPEAGADKRYGYLQQLAQGLHALHQAGAMLEGLRPDLIVITSTGLARVADVSDLLALPMRGSAPIRGTLYTAPELVLNPTGADGRADLYSFGALIYSLEYLHHNLDEKDFERQFVPKQVTDRFPDVHPLFPRLINKTFTREPDLRFPSDEAIKTDPSGMQELVKTLEICRRTFDRVRLDISAWTTTGMVRTGNEDTFGFLHGAEARQDDVYEYAMVLLADGMGGYEAGEVAAAMCVAEMRKFLLQQPAFAGLTGKDSPAPITTQQVPDYKKLLQAALKHAHKEVYTASRTTKGRRGMGCTAEVVFLDCHNVVVGHVGDSRVYHLHEGRLVQMTRDQTLVNRLVELGRLTPEEAENHDQKNQLQQAIGGQPEVNPEMYHGKLKRGDWVLVCSDGLSNHISNAELEKMLTREATGSAEDAARRLLNLVNLRGATDNATLVVVRAT